MRVLVTGANGLLGGTLVPRVRAGGHTVLTCSRSSGDVQVDLTDAARTYAALTAAAPNVIVNLAALTNVDECERDPQRAFLENTRIVENIAAWIRAAGTVAHLIQISTDQVYDGAGPHREADVVLTNYYGFSKYAGELAASTVSGTILRTNFFGRSQCPQRASFSDWLVRSFRERAAITLFEDVVFSPLSLRTLTDCLDAVVAQRHAGVFNLGSTTAMSKADFAFALADALGLSTAAARRGKSADAPMTARRPTDMSMDSSRFQDTFGVTLPTLQTEIERQRTEYSA